MFQFSKMNPELTLKEDSYKNLGDKLVKAGNRILLICSGSRSERSSLDRIKELLTLNNLTYIQYNQLKENLNRDNLNQIIQRAKDFNVLSVITLGDFEQLMAGRYISETLQLPCFELPTNFYSPYLLSPLSIFSNRVEDGYECENISKNRVQSITVDRGLQKDLDELENILSVLSILVDLSQLFISTNNNLISKNESRNLFIRILELLESGVESIDKLYSMGLTASLYQQISSETELYLTLFSWVAGYRFKKSPYIFSVKLLPWFLIENDEEELGERVKEILLNHNLHGRLTELGITLEQLISVAGGIESTINIIKKAF